MTEDKESKIIHEYSKVRQSLSDCVTSDVITMSKKINYPFKNIDVVNHMGFNYSEDVQIEKLFWIALQSETHTYRHWFYDSYKEICKEAFPELNLNTDELTDEACREKLQQDHYKWGLLAEVHYQSPNSSGSYVHYMYGESREELFEKIKRKAAEMYNEGEEIDAC